MNHFWRTSAWLKRPTNLLREVGELLSNIGLQPTAAGAMIGRRG
jgi:hypothetical protein